MNISTSFLWDLMWKCLHRNPRIFFPLKDSPAFAIVLLITSDSHQTLCSPLRTQERTLHGAGNSTLLLYCLCPIWFCSYEIIELILNFLGCRRVQSMILYANTSSSLPYTLKTLVLFRHTSVHIPFNSCVQGWREKILIFIYPTYNHNWRNISIIYI